VRVSRVSLHPAAKERIGRGEEGRKKKKSDTVILLPSSFPDEKTIFQFDQSPVSGGARGERRKKKREGIGAQVRRSQYHAATHPARVILCRYTEKGAEKEEKNSASRLQTAFTRRRVFSWN